MNKSNVYHIYDNQVLNPNLHAEYEISQFSQKSISPFRERVCDIYIQL